MSNNDERPTEENGLKELLAPLAQIHPDSDEMKRWSTAVRGAINSSPVFVPKKRSPLPLQLIAAMLVGFILGAVLFYGVGSKNLPEWQQNIGSDATFERTHTNLN